MRESGTAVNMFKEHSRLNSNDNIFDNETKGNHEINQLLYDDKRPMRDGWYRDESQWVSADTFRSPSPSLLFSKTKMGLVTAVAENMLCDPHVCIASVMEDKSKKC